MSVLWSKPIICRVEGCYWYTFFDDLKQNLENVAIHEILAHPKPVKETIPKSELLELVECPVCLEHMKPPLQVSKIVFTRIDDISTFPLGLAVSTRPRYLFGMQNKTRVEELSTVPCSKEK